MIENYRILPIFTEFYRVLPSCTEFFFTGRGFRRMIEHYRVLPSFSYWKRLFNLGLSDLT